jgi:hypothetical protein
VDGSSPIVDVVSPSHLLTLPYVVVIGASRRRVGLLFAFHANDDRVGSSICAVSSSLARLLGDHMYSRNRVLALIIASSFMAATLYSQSNSSGQMSSQQVMANKANGESAALVPGHTYRDSLASGGEGPEMVVLPGGKFAMGSPKDEVGREENEGPVHDVSVRSFALGKYPVTRGEFSRFASAAGYKTDAEKDTPIPFQPAELGTPVACFAYRVVARTAGKLAPVGVIRATSRAMMSR